MFTFILLIQSGTSSLSHSQVCSLSCKLARTLGVWINGARSLAEVCKGHRMHCTCCSLHGDARVGYPVSHLLPTDFLIVALLKTHNMYVPLLRKPLRNTLQKVACVVVSTAALCTAVVC